MAAKRSLGADVATSSNKILILCEDSSIDVLSHWRHDLILVQQRGQLWQDRDMLESIVRLPASAYLPSPDDDREQLIGTLGRRVGAEITVQTFRPHGQVNRNVWNVEGYAIACLCVHVTRDADTFFRFAETCKAAGVVAVAIADARWYRKEDVIADVPGLARCLSTDLASVLKRCLSRE